MAENRPLSSSKVCGGMSQETFPTTTDWSDNVCLYLLALVQLFCLSTACTGSLSCQWVTFNACKTLCLRLAFMKYTRSMDCPKQSFKFPWASWHPKSYKDVSLPCAQEGEEWYSIWSSILCHRRIASARHILSSLCLLHDTTGTELSFVPFYQWRVFTDSVTEATATWNPMFKT